MNINIFNANQIDLEGEEQLAAVEASICAINPTARRLRTHKAAVDVAAILDLHALAGNRYICPSNRLVVCFAHCVLFKRVARPESVVPSGRGGDSAPCRRKVSIGR